MNDRTSQGRLLKFDSTGTLVACCCCCSACALCSSCCCGLMDKGTALGSLTVKKSKMPMIKPGMPQRINTQRQSCNIKYYIYI